MKKTIPILVIITILFLPALSSAHCEIPCGIYDDAARFTSLREHITTMETSMNLIIALADDTTVNYNQLVRWVNNKESHADKFSEIVSQYFLTQRVQTKAANDVGYEKYQKQLILLHKMMVTTMKCKQTTDLDHIKKLRTLVDDFENTYFSKK